VEDPVPLSEEELRLLEQMERALVEEDPKLACFVLGIAVMMSGAITETWPLGIAGFVIMLGSATIAVTAIRGQQAAGSESRSSGHPAHGFTVIDGGRSGRSRRKRRVSSASFMDRMEDRWRRRREQNGGF
jgi:hypothetical protein